MSLQQLNDRQFQRYQQFIYQHSGIWFDPKKRTLLSNRIRRRLIAGGFADYDDYLAHLHSPNHRVELAKMLDAVTTNETFFFRTQKQFDWLSNELLTEVIQQERAGQRAKSLRILSAGCANGAEPYSIAICLTENLFRLRGWSLDVVGTDISQEELDQAMQGRFRQRALDQVSAPRLRRHFSSVDESHWEIRPQVRSLVKFQKHNLMLPMAGPSFDCIFIRNVLIYFDATSKQVVLKHLLQKLAAGGYLVIGPSEGIYDYLASLRRISPLIYQKPNPTLDSPLPSAPRGAKP